MRRSHPDHHYAAIIACLLFLAAGIGLGQYLETTVPVGGAPVDILWNPTSNKVYVANNGTDNVTIIDGATNQVVATVDVPECPSFLTWNSQQNRVYVACGEADRVAVIDGVTNAVISTVRITDYPAHMAYNATMNKLYVSCLDNNRIAVLDAGPDTVVTYIDMRGVGALAWHPVSNRVFSYTHWNADTVKVIDCIPDAVVVRLAAEDDLAPGTWCLNTANSLMYHAGYDAIRALTPLGDSQVARIPGRSGSIAAVPTENKLYVIRSTGIEVVDCWTHLVTRTLAGYSGWLMHEPTHGRVYCSARTAAVFDAHVDTLIKTIPLGIGPGVLCWNSTDSRVYIVDGSEHRVYVIRDTTTAIAEELQRDGSLPAAATVVAGTISLQPGESGRLLNSAGREVAVLRTGHNDVSGLPRGVYYLVPPTSGRVRRVLLAR